MSLMKEESHAGEQVLPEQGKEAKIHSSSPGWGRGRVPTPLLAWRTSSRHNVFKELFIGDERVFSGSGLRMKPASITRVPFALGWPTVVSTGSLIEAARRQQEHCKPCCERSARSARW